MRLLYNIAFTLFFCLSAPYYFVRMARRGNWRDGFEQRFGRFNAKIKQALTNRHMLWLHAVSVGEVNMCTQLIAALEPRLPNLKIVVSTTTTTGMGELQRKLPSHILKIYYPIDRRGYVGHALATIHPQAIVLVEAEIWPNFLWRAQELRIPVFLVNARLSQRSRRGYKLFGFLFRPLFAALAGVGCQDEADAARLRALGCQPEAIHVVGNLKFDAAKLDERRPLDVPALLRQAGVPPGAPLLVAGSTHAGEEAILAEVVLRLKKRFPDLFLILVPRHFERGHEVGKVLEACGMKFAYRKDITRQTQYKEGHLDCLLVNTTGELKSFYEPATLVFVGKSLTAEGGQNPLEPGILGKPLVFGPHMENFAAMTRALLEQNGAVQVQDAAGLESALAELLADPARAAQLGHNAQLVIRQNQGAIDRTVAMIISKLKHKEEIYGPTGNEMAKPAHITLGDGTVIPILYEDRSVLGIDKPAGWLLVPSHWERTGRNLQLALESGIGADEYWARSRNLKFLRFVHRLDAETSGVLLLVKNRGAMAGYSELFESREVRKWYLAVVRGRPKATEWTCALPIMPDPAQVGKMTVPAAGRSSLPRDAKPAETRFRVVGGAGALTALAVWPLTGRTHQIRVHLATAGFPVLHDPLYGAGPAAGAMGLRAVALAYRDPFTGRPVRIEAPWDDFTRQFGLTIKREEMLGQGAP